MSKKLLVIAAVIIVIGAAASYLFILKDKELFSFPSSFSSSSEEDLIGFWKLEKHIYWYPTTNELKEMSLPPGSDRQYLEFKSNSQLCLGGELDAKGQPLPCNRNGTFEVDGDTLTLHVAEVADLAGTQSVKWEIKDGKLTMIIDVARPADLPLLKIKNVFTRIEVQAPPPPPPQVKKNDKVPSDWQTYESKEYGFSIKYPPDYIQTEQKELDEYIIAFSPKQEGVGWQMLVIVREEPYGKAIEEFRKNVANGAEEKPRSINGINGIEFRADLKGETGVNKSGIWVIIPYNDRGLGFATTAPDKITLENEVIPLFNVFLSSFTPAL